MFEPSKTYDLALPKAPRFNILGDPIAAAKSVSADEAQEAADAEAATAAAIAQAGDEAASAAGAVALDAFLRRDLLRATAMEAVDEARRAAGRPGEPWTSTDAKAAYLIGDLLLVVAGLGGHATARVDPTAEVSAAPRRAVVSDSKISPTVEKGVAETVVAAPTASAAE